MWESVQQEGTLFIGTEDSKMFTTVVFWLVIWFLWHFKHTIDIRKAMIFILPVC